MSLLVQSSIEGILDRAFKEKGKLRAGNNLSYHCPFCFHRKRKMEVCLEEPYPFHCWTCDTKGFGISRLVNKMNCSSVIKDELKKLNLREDSTVVKKEIISGEIPPLILPDGFKSLTYSSLLFLSLLAEMVLTTKKVVTMATMMTRPTTTPIIIKLWRAANINEQEKVRNQKIH